MPRTTPARRGFLFKGGLHDEIADAIVGAHLAA